MGLKQGGATRRTQPVNRGAGSLDGVKPALSPAPPSHGAAASPAKGGAPGGREEALVEPESAMPAAEAAVEAARKASWRGSMFHPLKGGVFALGGLLRAIFKTLLAVPSAVYRGLVSGLGGGGGGTIGSGPEAEKPPVKPPKEDISQEADKSADRQKQSDPVEGREAAAELAPSSVAAQVVSPDASSPKVAAKDGGLIALARKFSQALKERNELKGVLDEGYGKWREGRVSGELVEYLKEPAGKVLLDRWIDSKAEVEHCGRDLISAADGFAALHPMLSIEQVLDAEPELLQALKDARKVLSESRDMYAAPVDGAADSAAHGAKEDLPKDEAPPASGGEVLTFGPRRFGPLAGAVPGVEVDPSSPKVALQKPVFSSARKTPFASLPKVEDEDEPPFIDAAADADEEDGERDRQYRRDYRRDF